jgi:hypothetical protein
MALTFNSLARRVTRGSTVTIGGSISMEIAPRANRFLTGSAYPLE